MNFNLSSVKNFLLCFIVIVLISLSIITSLRAQQPPNFTNDLISTGWDEIEGFVWDSTGQQYVWEKKGVVWIVDTNGVKLPTPLIDLQHEVGNWRDHGLNGFALHPDFRNNGLFYLFYTVDRYHLFNENLQGYDSTSNEYFNATIARVTRYQANSATNFTSVVPGSRFIMIGETRKKGIAVLFESHSAGTLLFGTDGSLIATAGDGAYYNDVDAGSFQYSYYIQALADSIITQKENVGSFRSQLIDCLNGKILRMDPMTGDGLSSNPYFDPAFPRAPRSRVYSLGLRNPFRVTLRPGTGNTDPSAGFPGVFYIGDVGWDSWEDVNINTLPGQNFGWPLFEGLQVQPGYWATNAENRDAPNPLFGVNGCTREFFRFKDLLQQATLNPNASFPNPCNANVMVPANIPTYFHTRPIIDYKHGYYTGITRTGIFVGQNASVIAINDPASPIQGDTFPGFASIAGIWYNDTRFPPAYQNTYFHADFVGGWIKQFIIDEDNVASQINGFAINTGYIDYIGLNPVTGCINYGRYPNEMREICYTGPINNLPVAVALSDTSYGASPLTVNFNGSQSSDPENLSLSYFWQFGDGSTSNSANPSHTYVVGGNVPTSYYARLTVTDNIGQVAKDSVFISVNNTPPVVTITSFDDGDLYSMNNNSTLPLTATVTDAQHNQNQLFYEWTTYLVHNSHSHIEQADTNKISSTIISPLGCQPNATYNFRIELRVTDAAGLSTTVSSSVYPACDPPSIVFTASDTTPCKGDMVQFTDLSANFPNQWNWSFPGGIPSSSTLQNPLVNYPNGGNYTVTLTATSTRGTSSVIKNAYIKVKVLPNISIVSSNGTGSFCGGTPYSLYASSTSNITSWQWTRFGSVFGGNVQTLPLTQGGAFKVKVTDTNGCTKVSQKFDVVKNPVPVANVTVSGPLQFCPPSGSVTFSVTQAAGNTYQWKRYGINITGATGPQYTATTSGQYKVIVTNSFNCIKSSLSYIATANCRDSFIINDKAINPNQSFVYPNPANGLVNLVFTLSNNDKLTLEMLDVTGRNIEVFKERMFEEGVQEVEFDVSDYAPGIYLLVLKSDSSTETFRLVITDR